MILYVYNYLKLMLDRANEGEEGATMIEYGLLAALLGVALIATLVFLQGGLDSIFTTAGDELNAAAAG
ncbi:MAG: Flp family type IVb pilin [Phycisphaerales bacterium]